MLDALVPRDAPRASIAGIALAGIAGAAAAAILDLVVERSAAGPGRHGRHRPVLGLLPPGDPGGRGARDPALASTTFEGAGEWRGEYYPLLLFATAGMTLIVAAADLILVFLALEILSLSLYLLTGFSLRRIAAARRR